MNKIDMPNRVNPSECTALILAAGLSIRMGAQNKLTIPVLGKPLLQHMVDAVTEAGINKVILVLGHEQELVESCLNISSVNNNVDGSNGVNIVINPDYKNGHHGSVMCGLRVMGKTTGPTLICLGDQPLINSDHITALLHSFTLSGNKQVVIPRVNGQRGNPIIISELVRHAVLSENHKKGCRWYIDTHPEELLWFDSEESAFITDLDTLDDVRMFFSQKTVHHD